MSEDDLARIWRRYESISAAVRADVIEESLPSRVLLLLEVTDDLAAALSAR